MTKRGRLEILKDILTIVKESNNGIKFTPLLRKTNLSSSRFLEYYKEMLNKEFLIEKIIENGKKVFLTEKGERFLEKYRNIFSFIDEFGL